MVRPESLDHPVLAHRRKNNLTGDTDLHSLAKRLSTFKADVTSFPPKRKDGEQRDGNPWSIERTGTIATMDNLWHIIWRKTRKSLLVADYGWLANATNFLPRFVKFHWRARTNTVANHIPAPSITALEAPLIELRAIKSSTVLEKYTLRTRRRNRPPIHSIIHITTSVF